MAGRYFNSYEQHLDDSGLPVENGTLTFYLNETTTLATIYSDADSIVPQSNPYTLDASGRVTGDIWFTGKLRYILKDQFGAEIRTIDDNVVAGDDGALPPTSNPLIELTKTLLDGQTSVVFGVDLTYASVYVNSDDGSVDRGRLKSGDDYSVDLGTGTITLVRSYPAGSKLTVAYNDVGSDETTVRTFDTVADLKDQTLGEGVIATTKGYYVAGDGGGASYLIAGSQSVDGWGSHTLANGNTAILQSNNSVRRFGAIDNVDSTDALNAFASAIAGNSGRVEAGTYLTDTGVRLDDNTTLYGDGIDISVIKLSDTAGTDAFGLTNTQNTGSALTNNGNENIEVRDLTVDGNGWRGGVTGGSAIAFAYVTYLRIVRVKGFEGYIHCIDISNAEYTTTTFAGSGCYDVSLIDCIGEDSHIDDGITTHHSQQILMVNPRGIRSGNRALTYSNQHGVEIDDGSIDVVIQGGYANGWYVGMQIKGHPAVPAVSRLSVDGFTAEGNTRNFMISHGGALDGTSYAITLDNCTSIKPVQMLGLGSAEARFLLVEYYDGVRVNNFNMIGDPTKTTDAEAGGLVLEQEASNVSIENVYMQDVNRPSGTIHIYAGGGDGNRIMGVRALNCYAPIIRNSLDNYGIKIEDVKAFTDNVGSPQAGIIELALNPARNEDTIIDNVTGNAGYDAAIIDFPTGGDTINIPLGGPTGFGASNRWVKATSSGDVAGDIQWVHSVGWASGDQDLGADEAVGYGFRFRRRDDSPYVGAGVGGLKPNSTDLETGMDLGLYSRNDGDAGTGTTLRWRVKQDGHFLPEIDDTYDIGSGSYRVSTIHLVNTPSVTSDERLKSDIQDLSDKEKAVALILKESVKTYLMNGSDKRQVGFIAQEVITAFDSQGLDSNDYDLVDTSGPYYSLKYSAILAFIIGAL